MLDPVVIQSAIYSGIQLVFIGVVCIGALSMAMMSFYAWLVKEAERRFNAK